MSARPDREDVSAQIARLTTASRALSDVLLELSKAARYACRAKNPDLDEIYALTNRVRNAEADVDTAYLDLATARGGHA